MNKELTVSAIWVKNPKNSVEGKLQIKRIQNES